MAQQRANATKVSTPQRAKSPGKGSHQSLANSFVPGGFGNQALSRLLQGKRIQSDPAVSEPNEPYELEADRLAEAVMRMPAGSRLDGRLVNPTRSSPQQFFPQPEDTSDFESATSSTNAAPVLFPERLANSIGNGKPLTDDTRVFMESRFGVDLSQVRVHNDLNAAEMNEELGAQAFTTGSEIYFGAGKAAGKNELTVHELAHIVAGHGGLKRLWRKPKGVVTEGEIQVNAEPQPQEEKWERLWVKATGMDAAAKVLAPALAKIDKRKLVLIGLHPQFLKVYDSTGASLGRIPFKDDLKLTFNPGVYAVGPDGLTAITVSTVDPNRLKYERDAEGKLRSVIGQRPLNKKEQEQVAEEQKKAKQENRAPKPIPIEMVDIGNAVTDPAKLKSLVQQVPGGILVYFVPKYDVGEGGKGGGESKGIYASPIQGRGDGQPANAPPWPVSMEGPKLVPIDSDPTYAAKVDWTANGNFSLASQVISQVGETIYYKWELFDITQYARKQLAKDPAGTKESGSEKPEKTLDQRIEDFKKSKSGTGTDVTGMGGANREFNREFEDWWKDTKRANKGVVDPNGDTTGERLSNAAANRLSLELAPVSLLTTAVGAALKWVAELFAGPRQQQEIPLKKEGVFLIRVITTPGINEDREGKQIIRPPSVAANVTEVTPMEKAVNESLDEPGAQLAELQSQIDLAEKAGNKDKADYLRSLLSAAKQRLEGSPKDLLTAKREQKQKELEKFQHDYPTLSDYSRKRDVEMLDDQIKLYDRHEAERKKGAPAGLSPMQRLNATLISEVTGEQYPLLLSAGPMAMEGDTHRWMISDVTNRSGNSFIGLGSKPSEALRSAFRKFGAEAAYGRGRLGLRTAGLALEKDAPPTIYEESQPADWALAEKRIDDLVTTLAVLGLMVASAGTAGALLGAAVAAARLIKRWQAGTLYLDAQTVGDALGLLGGLGAAGQLAGGLRVQKFEKVFAITQEGRASETQIARAAEALKGAQTIAKGVEIANEAINYAGVIWGNVSFIDQMMSINAEESSGTITHAAARRQRAMAISSAVQNNGLFIAGNVLKAKQAANEKNKTSQPAEKVTPKEEKVTGEPAAKEPPKEKITGEDKPQDKTEDRGAAGKPEPLPISERQATPAELKAALPADLRKMLVIDESLHGDSAEAHYKLDEKTGLISEITLSCSPDVRPDTVRLHTETLRAMQRYQGFSGRVRQAIAWVGELIGVTALSPEKNPKSFEAVLEIQKLPKLIEAQMEAMKRMDPNAREKAEGQLEHLKVQLDKHLRTLELGGGGEAAGYVASKGLSKAKQKKYDELRAKLREHDAGTAKHKSIRREMYELIGGDLPYASWEKVYESNVERANKANVSVAAEHKRLGWGKPEQTIEMGKGEVRRLDIADTDPKVMKGAEVKEYETGVIYANEEILSEVQRDAKLVKRGWDITWILVDTEPSGPLLTALLAGGIPVEIRTRGANGNSRLVTRHLPPAKTKAKAK
jgi:hypothetical protein